MNFKKISSQYRAASNHVRPTQLVRTGVVQPKLNTVSQARKPPVAPPVYRPQSAPRVMQTKMSVRPATTPDQVRTHPVAPPVYRPQATPKAMQPKMVKVAVNRRPPAAPPANRPEQKKNAQPKMALTGTPMASKFPPVHRPPAKPRPEQMKAQTVAPRVSRSQSVQRSVKGVVQLTSCDVHKVENCQLCGSLLGLLSGTVPGAQSITRNIFSFLSNQDLGSVSVLSGASHDFASMELDRRHRLELMRQSGRQDFRLGVFSGVYERALNRNWADLHITGALGHSIDNSHLVKILKWLYVRMDAWHRQCGVVGVLEWHPTGAVVTKQVVELLACTLGSGFKLGKAFGLQKWRKFREDKGKRNKFAALIEKDILPEFFAFLDCLRGVKGIQMVGVFAIKPSYYESLSPVDKQKFKEQNMLAETLEGTERYSQFVHDYPEGNVPSLKVLINYKLIPLLIQAIESQK